MSGHVFIAVSVDGKIATLDGGVDWLDVPGEAVADDGTPDDHGWPGFIAGVDALIMGRGTFEKVLTFGEWPYELPVVVMSSTLDDVPAHLEGRVELTSDDPATVVAAQAERGRHQLYVDGGRLVTSFLRAGLVDSLTITTIPVVLGSGIPLFGEIERPVWLRHESTRALSNGMVQTRYAVVGDPG